MKRSELRNMILEELSKHRKDRQNIDNIQSSDDIDLQNNANKRLKFSLSTELKKIRSEYTQQDLYKSGETLLTPSLSDKRIYEKKSKKNSISKKQARKVYNKLGYTFDFNQFWRGINIESEHSDVTLGDLIKTGKIAAAHLKEVPNYYDLLDKYVEKNNEKFS